MKLNCDTIIIDGVLYEYTYKETNLHIDDSYKVSKRNMEGALLAIELAHPHIWVFQRGIKALKREWAVHNLCYSLGIARKETADVDLNYPNRWGWLYNIIGAIALIFIK